MTDASDEEGWTRARRTQARLSAALTNAARVVAPRLLFGLRLWASVCLALYVAFWLELDNAFWAGTTAAIVCQPQLGASLRKGWYRMIGTLIGAVMIVVLTAWFPQDRALFLIALALWAAACALVATLLHSFASYAAALAGYTAAIIAADELGATGGPNADAVFLLAVYRASEICIGIVSAGIVLAGTDFGGAQRRLAALFAALSAEITGRFTGMLALAGPEMPETQPARRELVRRVIALDPVIDEAKGESSRNPLPFAGVAESCGWFVRRPVRLAHGGGAAGAAAGRRGSAGGRCRVATRSAGAAIGGARRAGGLDGRPRPPAPGL